MNLIKQPACNKAYRLVAVFNSNKLGYVFIHFSQSVLRAITDYLYVSILFMILGYALIVNIAGSVAVFHMGISQVRDDWL